MYSYRSAVIFFIIALLFLLIVEHLSQSNEAIFIANPIFRIKHSPTKSSGWGELQRQRAPHFDQFGFGNHPTVCCSLLSLYQAYGCRSFMFFTFRDISSTTKCCVAYKSSNWCVKSCVACTKSSVSCVSRGSDKVSMWVLSPWSLIGFSSVGISITAY